MAKRQPLWRHAAHWVVSPTSARNVMALLGSVGVYSTGQAFAWRGLGSADFALTSSLQRALPDAGESEIRAAEQALLQEARSWGLGITGSGFVDDLQLLADLQHYGVGTRLLDFSANPMTALWFACQKSLDPSSDLSKSGLVLALNITKIRRYKTLMTTAPTYASVSDPLSHQLEEALATGEPFVVESMNPNDRIKAQEGMFVAGATPSPGLARDQTPFQSFQYPPGRTKPPKGLDDLLLGDRGRGAPATVPYVAIIIRSHLKRRLLDYLQGSYNRAAQVLFPDYQGFATYGSSVRPRT